MIYGYNFSSIMLSFFTKLSTFRTHILATMDQRCIQMAFQSNFAKVHGSISVDALQRKESERSACGKLHDPAFKIT